MTGGILRDTRAEFLGIRRKQKRKQTRKQHNQTTQEHKQTQRTRETGTNKTRLEGFSGLLGLNLLGIGGENTEQRKEQSVTNNKTR